MKQRNYVVDGYKFIFAFMILMVHTNGLRVIDPHNFPFVGAYIAVEFFFMVSGYFLTCTAVRLWNEEEKPTGLLVAQNVIKKFSKYWGITTIATILLYCVQRVCYPDSITLILKEIMLLPFDLFYLPMSGLNGLLLDVPLWYMSVLLIVMPVVLYLLLKLKDVYIYVFAPTITVFIWGYFWNTYGHLEFWHEWNGVCYSGVLRGLAALNAGIVCYALSKKITETVSTGGKRLALTVLEMVCYLMVLVLMYARGFSELDFLKAGLLLVAISITMSRKSYIYEKCNWKWLEFFGDWSFTLYATHWILRVYIVYAMPDAGYEQMLIPYIAASLALSLLFVIVWRWWRRKHEVAKKTVKE